MITNLNILLIDNKTKVLDKLIDLLSTYGNITTVAYNQIQTIEHNNFDLIILSGGSGIHIEKSGSKFDSEFKLILNSSIPIIGICFGFELICLAYGCNLTEQNETADEFRIIKLDREFFKDASEDIVVKEFHKWNIEKVTPELIVLGASAKQVEIVKHKSRQVYGFQFHPELYRDLTQGDDLLKIVIDKIFK